MGIKEGATAVAKSPVGFARGLSYGLRGMRFVYFKHPGLIRYWIFPILITAAALVSVFYGAGSLYQGLSELVWNLFPESWNSATGAAGAFLKAFHWLIDLLAGLVIVLLGLVLVFLLSSVVAAPFNDALSEAVEGILTGEAAPPFSFTHMIADVFRTVRLELFKVLFYAAVVGPIFLVSLFLPGIGQVVSLIAFALTAIYLGIDYIDWPAARRDWSVGDRLAFARQRLPAIAGFGTGVWVLLFIPIVNLFFMPAAVAGGTMLFVEMNRRSP